MALAPKAGRKKSRFENFRQCLEEVHELLLAPVHQSTKDLLLVSRALGHRDVKSTLRYAHLGDHILAKAMNRMW